MLLAQPMLLALEVRTSCKGVLSSAQFVIQVPHILFAKECQKLPLC